MKIFHTIGDVFIEIKRADRVFTGLSAFSGSKPLQCRANFILRKHIPIPSENTDERRRL
jgi:hypothetical protein